MGGTGGIDAHSLRLPLSGWTLRTARGAGSRPALEVYSPSGFVDVSVATGFGPGILRGARRGRRQGRLWSLAWGHVPAAGTMVGVPERAATEAEPRVVFRRWRQEHRIAPTLVLGGFWVAEVEGGFRSVAISAGPAQIKARLATA